MAKSSGAKCVSSASWWHPTPKFLMTSPVVSCRCWTTLLPPLLCSRLSNGPQFMIDLIHPKVFFSPVAFQMPPCLLHYFWFHRKTRADLALHERKWQRDKEHQLTGVSHRSSRSVEWGEKLSKQVQELFRSCTPNCLVGWEAGNKTGNFLLFLLLLLGKMASTNLLGKPAGNDRFQDSFSLKLYPRNVLTQTLVLITKCLVDSRVVVHFSHVR